MCVVCFVGLVVECCSCITLHCRVVCWFPLGVFKTLLTTECVDMTKVAFLGCGESADWVRSKGKRCCLSDFETPESAPRTRVKRGDFISFGYSRGEVIWIVLVSRAWWRQSFTYLCQAKKNDFDILGWTEESSLNITLVCHLNIQPPVQFLGWKQYIPTGLISASTLLQVSVFCLICNKKTFILWWQPPHLGPRVVGGDWAVFRYCWCFCF